MPLTELEDIAQAGRRGARARQRLHGPDRVGPPPQADHRRRRGPAPPAPAAHRAHHRRAARRRPAAHLRGRRRLVRLRREPRRRVAGDRRRGRHRARPPPAWAPPRSARCAPPAAAARTSRRPRASMDEVVRGLGNPQFTLTAILARWHAPTATLAWINCGHPPGFVADPDGTLTELDGPVHAPLGSADGTRRVRASPPCGSSPRDRLVLVTDGITDRAVEGGGTFGVDGLRRAVATRPPSRRPPPRWRSSTRSRTAGPSRCRTTRRSSCSQSTEAGP